MDLSDGHNNMMELSFDEKFQSDEDNVHFSHTPTPQKENQSNNFHLSSNLNNIYSHVTPQQSQYYEETHIPFIITPYPDSNEVKKNQINLLKCFIKKLWLFFFSKIFLSTKE